MSTDYHLRLTASDGSQAVITIADSINPLPGSDTWSAADQSQWGTSGGAVSSWASGGAYLTGPVGVESIFLDGFGKHTNANDAGDGRRTTTTGTFQWAPSTGFASQKLNWKDAPPAWRRASPFFDRRSFSAAASSMASARSRFSFAFSSSSWTVLSTLISTRNEASDGGLSVGFGLWRLRRWSFAAAVRPPGPAAGLHAAVRRSRKTSLRML